MASDPLVDAAASGTLPSWAEVTTARRSHLGRVAELMDDWGRELGLGEPERARWRAAGYLHDALRDADPDTLRPRVPPALRGLPPLLLHGPAAAQRLWAEGVRDGPLLRAVAYHTLGHEELDAMGRFLYAADFLEPGRDLLNDWRAGLRERMPGDGDDVVREVLGARIVYLVERGSRIRPETAGFWNSLAREE